MPPARPDFGSRLAPADRQDEDARGFSTVPLTGPEATDMIIAVAKATDLDAEAISRIRLADVLWGNCVLFIREGAGVGRQVHIPQQLRDRLYDYLQGRLHAGIPDDPEAPVFEVPPQIIDEALAKAAAIEHWAGVSASVEELLSGAPREVASPDAVDSVTPMSAAPGGVGMEPGAGGPSQMSSSLAIRASDKAFADNLMAGSPTALGTKADAAMGVRDPTFDPMAIGRNTDIPGNPDAIDINPLQGIGPGV